MVKGCSIWLLLLLGLQGNAQFTGGFDDGYERANLKSSISTFAGGPQDGYKLANSEGLSNIFTGGDKSGYDKATITNAIPIFLGSTDDGYDLDTYSSVALFWGGSDDGYEVANKSSAVAISLGGSGDGYDLDSHSSVALFFGGSGDGYNLTSKIIHFIWTGTVGTGWNVTGNWQDGIVPNVNSPVIIPESAINFPAINEGLMSIGSNPNGGIYFCKQILVRSGAELTFRTNAFLENYGEMEIQGSVYVLNTTLDAFKNLGGGKITIASGGLLQLQN